MMNIVLSFAVPLLLCLLLTPLMISIAKRRKVFDLPSSRKVHTSPTPLLGGIAILIAAVVSFILFTTPTNPLLKLFVIIGFAGVAAIGLIDDIISLGPIKRLIVLFILAIIVYFGVIQFYFIRHLTSIWLTVVFGLIVVVWIVGITNAINFSDGIDGLSSFLSLIAALSFAVIFSIAQRTEFALPVALALVGAIAGFMPYNRAPALIFMGDAGSMSLGFMLGLLSITSIAKEGSILSFVVPVYILFVPIADMCMSILRRLIIRKPVMQPDRMHFHHVLNERFNNHMVVVIIMSLAQITFAAFGILIYVYKIYLTGVITLVGLLIIASIYTIATSSRIKKNQRVEER